MRPRRIFADDKQAATFYKTMLLVAVVAFSLATLIGVNLARPAAASLTTQPIAIANTGPAQTTYAAVVTRVAPAVVTVRSSGRARAPRQHPFLDDPSLREFFGDRLPRQPQQPRRQQGLGSGVVVTQDGYILTNHHVIDGAEEIKVELTDKRVFDAKLIGSDPPSDLAVLKIEAGNLPVLPLGDSDRVQVGDVVLAVGNPLGLGQTVTSGIISAKGRSTGLSDGSFEDFLQTDAPINSGNSGGALVNTSGELVGINSQILSPSGGNIGIGFAIPSRMAHGVMDQLMKNGKVRRGQLGVGIQSVTSDIAASLGLSEVRGVIVNSVAQGSPAERAGLRRGDVITAINGTPVRDGNSLRNQVASTQPGTEVTLTFLRDGREQQARCTLTELTADTKGAGEQGDAGDGASDGGKLGISVEPLTPETSAQLGLQKGAQGLVVKGVDPSGPAAKAGVQQGDVLVEVNRQPVRTVGEVQGALQRSGSRPALLLVNRGGNTMYLTVKPRK